MGKFLNGLRVSVMSVHERWWYAYLAAFFAQMAGWTGMRLSMATTLTPLST